MRLSTRMFFQFLFTGSTLSQHIPISSHELPSLPKNSMKSVDSENVTGLKFEYRTPTQSRTRSQF